MAMRRALPQSGGRKDVQEQGAEMMVLAGPQETQRPAHPPQSHRSVCAAVGIPLAHVPCGAQGYRHPAQTGTADPRLLRLALESLLRVIPPHPDVDTQ